MALVFGIKINKSVGEINRKFDGAEECFWIRGDRSTSPPVHCHS